MFLCTYCLEQKPDAERSDEHVVGAALGGTWTVNNVCETCQRWAASEIDEPFSQMLWTLEKRHRLRIPDRYGKVPLAPHQDVTLVDGRKGRITLVREGGWHLEIFPSRSDADDGSIDARLSADNETETLRKWQARFERDNPGFTWQIRDRQVEPRDHIDVTFPFSMSMTLWPRFAVKVGLNVGRELFGQAWLESEHGMTLNRLLWNTETKIQMKPLPTGRLPWSIRGYEPGPDHVLYVNIGVDGRPMLLISLFGEETYGVPLGDEPLPEKTVWLLHVHERSEERISRDEFFRRIITSLPPPVP
jgi:HNH endonuclease